MTSFLVVHFSHHCFCLTCCTHHDYLLFYLPGYPAGYLAGCTFVQLAGYPAGCMTVQLAVASSPAAAPDTVDVPGTLVVTTKDTVAIESVHSAVPVQPHLLVLEQHWLPAK